MPDPRTAARPATGASVRLDIVDAPTRRRYEAHRASALAGVLEYVLRPGRIVLVHTEVSPQHEGTGVAAALTRFALDDARRRSLRVVPSCPYVKRYLAKHPEDLDIVVGEAPNSATAPATPTGADGRDDVDHQEPHRETSG